LCAPRTTSHKIGAFYGLIFLLAVVSAPHHHLNSFDDLVSDGVSDSGRFVPQPAAGSDPCISVKIEVDDDPCLACFQHDYSAAASYLFLVLQESRSFRLARQGADPLAPQSVSDSPASRSPPGSPRLS
jgi:hypothetical protein